MPAAGSRARRTRIWDLFFDCHDVTYGLTLAHCLRRNADWGKGRHTDRLTGASFRHSGNENRTEYRHEGGTVTLLSKSKGRRRSWPRLPGSEIQLSAPDADLLFITQSIARTSVQP